MFPLESGAVEVEKSIMGLLWVSSHFSEHLLSPYYVHSTGLHVQEMKKSSPPSRSYTMNNSNSHEISKYLYQSVFSREAESIIHKEI